MIPLDPGRSWRATGEVVVFATPAAGGRRRLLLQVGPGAVLDGVAPAGGWRLVAVPLGEAALEPAEPGGGFLARACAAAGVPASEGMAGIARALDARGAEEEQVRERRRERRAERAADEEAVAERVVRRFADAGAEVPPPIGDPLWDAAALVARERGFSLTRRPIGALRGDPVQHLARAARCRARRVELVGRWWAEPGPALLATRGGRWVALLTDRLGGYVLVDPAVGGQRAVDAAVARDVGALAWELVRPLPDGAPSLAGLWRFAFAGAEREVARAVLWGLGVTLAGLAVPVATGLVVDEVLPDADLAGLLALGGAVIGVTLGGAVFELAQATALLRLDTLVTTSAQMGLWDRLLRLPTGALRPFPVGVLVERVGSASAVGRRLTGATLQAALGGLLAVVDLALMLAYAPGLTLVGVACALLAVLAVVGPALAASRAAQALAHQRGKVFGAAVQVLGGVAKIRAAGAADAAVAWWWSAYRDQLRLRWLLWLAEARIDLVRGAVPGLSTAALFVAAPRHGDLSTGSFLAFVATFGVFLAGLTSLASSLVDLLEARAEAERARPLVEAAPEVAAASVDPGRLRGAVAVERARFRYRGDGPYVLDGLSLTLRPGELVAVVGASGCGKSTLVRLLLGFERPESGRVLYDGQDLSGLDLEAVRRQLGVVLQAGRVGNGSVLEVVSGAHAATLDEAWQALRAAGLAAEVEAMPMGIHTNVGEGGGNLSGGQRQRLLIARALVSRPKVLIFDEATSALDNRAQAEVAENLAKLDVTRLVIAHRLSTIRAADRIVVLEEGRVAQSGTFDELARVEGPFRRLVRPEA